VECVECDESGLVMEDSLYVPKYCMITIGKTADATSQGVVTLDIPLTMAPSDDECTCCTKLRRRYRKPARVVDQRRR
jgi:hypothetical protein